MRFNSFSLLILLGLGDSTKAYLQADVDVLNATGICLDCDLMGLETSQLRPGLSITNLSESDLSRASLSGINLTDAIMSNVNLSKTALVNVNLTGANLVNADLSEARLMNVNLYKANLFNASLERAYLIKTNLSKANLFNINTNGLKYKDVKMDGITFNYRTWNWPDDNFNGDEDLALLEESYF